MSFSEAVNAGSAEQLGETDRLIVDNRTLRKAPHSNAKETLRTETYERISGEGMDAIRTVGSVEFGLTIYKSAYIVSDQKPTADVASVVAEAHQSGSATELAHILSNAAEQAGSTSARQKVNYAVRAVQSFPYVKDTVDDDYDNYSKHPIETLVEAGGDCEDTVIMLASVFESELFGYDCVGIYLPYGRPEHIAVGVRGKSIPGSYYTYNGNRIITSRRPVRDGKSVKFHRNMRTSPRELFNLANALRSANIVTNAVRANRLPQHRIC